MHHNLEVGRKNWQGTCMPMGCSDGPTMPDMVENVAVVHGVVAISGENNSTPSFGNLERFRP
jgi:hypothetical protein